MRHTLILCAHGTADRRGRAILGGLANAVRRELPTRTIAEAFVADTEGPGVASVVGATSGPRTIVPLVVLGDVQARAEILAAADLDPLVTVGAPLGPDWVLAEVGVRRLMEAGARPADTIVLAADRVSDEQSAADVSQAARLLSAVWGGAVHVGTTGGGDVSLGEAMDVARAYGTRVVLMPYLLAPCDALKQMVAEADADVVTAPVLDASAPDPRLVALVCARATSRSHWTAPLDPSISQ